MQQQYQNAPPFFARCFICATLAWLALMNGCASNHLPESEKDNTVKTPGGVVQAVKPVKSSSAREVRVDFGAAMSFIKAGEYARGIVLLNKVTESEKNNAVPYINLAIAYGKVGDLKSAEENLKLALKIDPENPVASNEYAMLYRKTGRFIEARQLYERVLKKFPGFYMARKNLGILCDLYMRDYACALKQYEIYVDAMPDDKAVKIWIADVQKRLTQ